MVRLMSIITFTACRKKMDKVFADTSYYIALLVNTDGLHRRAVDLSRKYQGRIITTTWVMLELGNYCSSLQMRQKFATAEKTLRSSPHVLITPASDYDQGLKLYVQRLDKEWSLVDCLSFVTMQNQSITDAWTSDHHFEQAGFNALLV